MQRAAGAQEVCKACRAPARRKSSHPPAAVLHRRRCGPQGTPGCCCRSGCQPQPRCAGSPPAGNARPAGNGQITAAPAERRRQRACARALLPCAAADTRIRYLVSGRPQGLAAGRLAPLPGHGSRGAEVPVAERREHASQHVLVQSGCVLVLCKLGCVHGGALGFPSLPRRPGAPAVLHTHCKWQLGSERGDRRLEIAGALGRCDLAPAPPCLELQPILAYSVNMRVYCAGRATQPWLKVLQQGPEGKRALNMKAAAQPVTRCTAQCHISPKPCSIRDTIPQSGGAAGAA